MAKVPGAPDSVRLRFESPAKKGGDAYDMVEAIKNKFHAIKKMLESRYVCHKYASIAPLCIVVAYQSMGCSMCHTVGCGSNILEPFDGVWLCHDRERPAC